MAAIQTIRKHGKLLIAVIGIALLAFITEEFFRARQQTEGANANVIGTINGKKISTQDYNDMVEAVKFLRGQSSYSEAEDIQIKEQAWEQYVSNKLITAECEEIGITVTDKELSDLLSNPQVSMYLSQMLQNTPFVDPRMGFNPEMIKQLISYKKQMESSAKVNPQEAEYVSKMYAQWLSVESTIKAQLLREKYMALVTASFTSNPVEAEMAFNARTNAKDIYVAMVPFNTIDDKEVSVSDDDLKTKYAELKETFKMPYLTKDIKYVAYDVVASDADKAALAAKMASIKAELDTTDNVMGLVNRTSSVIYNGLPRTKASYPNDVQAYLDSMAVGAVKTYTNPADNTENIIKLIAKTTQADSIEVHQIGVPGKDEADVAQRADSILAAVSANKSDSAFSQIAQIYGQPGQAAWIDSKSYESFQMDEEQAKFIKALQGMSVGEIKKIQTAQGTVIAWLSSAKNSVTKYDAAVIKRTIDFSSETSKKERSRFSKFVSDNQTIAALEKNAAKNGYEVKSLKNFTTSAFYSTQAMYENPMISWLSNDAKRWLFDEAEDGEVSILYDGSNGAHFIVLAVEKTYEAGYKSMEDVKDYLTQLVKNDKKAAKIITSLKSAKTIEAVAQSKGAQADTMRNVNFYMDNNPYMSVDSKLIGSVAKAKVGQFVAPFQGQGGVYAYKVIADSPKDPTAKFDSRTEMKQAAFVTAQNSTTYAGRYDMVMPFLKLKANIVDNRYRFY